MSEIDDPKVDVRVDPGKFDGTHTFQFDSHTQWVVDDDGRLNLYQSTGDAEKRERVQVGQFAPGEWLAVLRFPVVVS